MTLDCSILLSHHHHLLKSEPWVGMHISSTKTEQDLFRASTQITVGNGQKDNFCHDRWLNGSAPKWHRTSLLSFSVAQERCTAQTVCWFTCCKHPTEQGSTQLTPRSNIVALQEEHTWCSSKGPYMTTVGVCFVAEDPIRRNTFGRSSQKQCQSYHP
jgi:hypothetical protein